MCGIGNPHKISEHTLTSILKAASHGEIWPVLPPRQPDRLQNAVHTLVRCAGRCQESMKLFQDSGHQSEARDEIFQRLISGAAPDGDVTGP